MNETILNNITVLVAEDNTINQLVVKHTLKKLGAKVEIVSDGTEAVERMKVNNYDLILMDIQMPMMDGYEATRQIRNMSGNRIPIIAMTAFALKGEDEKCYACGMNGYIAKPFTLESLQGTIVKALNLQANQTTVSNPHLITMGDVTVDISMLYEIAGNDEDYIHTMVSTFLENMPVTIEKIEFSLRDRDYDTLFKSAHYAKSSLSVIKINSMFEWVERIEQLAKNKMDLGELPVLVNQVVKKYMQAEKLLLQKFGTGQKAHAV